MRKRVKVVLKGKTEDSDESDLEGVDQVDWVESTNAKELLGNDFNYESFDMSHQIWIILHHRKGQTKYVSEKHPEGFNLWVAFHCLILVRK